MAMPDAETLFVDTNVLVYANIVATMQVYGICQLIMHNVDDFTRFSVFITVVPLIP
jgi:predicted nucleic acid-binding protein